MERVDKSKKYLETLKKRAKESRVYRPYQSAGLALADILQDANHKSLYIRLCKQHNSEMLIGFAKDIAERKGITNKGAYFMKVLKTKNYDFKKNLDYRQ